MVTMVVRVLEANCADVPGRGVPWCSLRSDKGLQTSILKYGRLVILGPREIDRVPFLQSHTVIGSLQMLWQQQLQMR